MKLKKLCAALMSGVLAVSALMTSFPIGMNLSKNKPISITAEAASTMRRPCSPDSPMLIVHIDTWNTADPAKIIALIPEDIKPYVVFNISLSINWSLAERRWLMVQDGYECAKSWLRTCADEGVWAMIQPSSGGQCHFPDYSADYNFENTLFGEFFRDYPNFIGFNYSEQFWGFEAADFPVTPIQRYQHFSGLLKLCNKYGGYLNISWCANRWSAPLNPVAMLKRCPEWKDACEKYSENLQLEEKYTQGSFIHDVESEILGAYLSGYCGNFGVRYDESGWTDLSADDKPLPSKDQYRQITSLPIHLERMALNGATIIDGPELIWADDFKETWGGIKDSEGYSCRNWEIRDQYYNSTLDFFRKLIDGTVRIPSRQEVIDRTQFVIIQDNNSGDDHNKYSTYPTLFEGLYRMPGDGNLWENTNLYKCTGRYPTIPTVYALRDDVAKSFKYQLKQSQLGSRWNSIAAKQEEFNKVFPSEYVGNCYVGRYENTWVAYNPNKRGDNCGAILPLKYNSCTSLDVNFNAYGTALINEYSDHIDIYTNNFDNKAQTTLKTDTFKINGCKEKPTYTAKDTGVNQTKSQITESFNNGTYTLTVKHNGPVSITINCNGNEVGKLAPHENVKLKAPSSPSFYTGIRQYEGEFFDVKNVEGYVQNACSSGITGIQGQGFLKFGKNANAQAKDTVRTQKSGEFMLTLRYSSTAEIKNVDLYVNGSRVETMSLSNTNGYSSWKTYSKKITLNQGDNKIEFKANSALPSSLYIDNFTVDGNFGDGNQNNIVSGNLIKDLKVIDSENAANWSIHYEFDEGSTIYGDRDFTAINAPENLVNAEMIRTACDSKLYMGDLGTFTAGADITVYAAVDTRVSSELEWLKAWTKGGVSIMTSNDVELELFKLNVKSGEKVVLGTNGGKGNSANYIVFAVQQEKIIKGDVNMDGAINALDMTLAKRGLISGFRDSRSFIAADVDSDEKFESDDLQQLQNFLLSKKTQFNLTPLDKPQPKTTAEAEDAENKVDFNYSANLQYKSAPAVYRNDCSQQGAVEKVTYNTTVYSNNLTKSAYVYLPYGYDSNKKYNVFYLMHGGGGNESSIFIESKVMKKYLDHMIMNGDIEPMIVVTPTFNNAAGSDMTANAKNFWNELAKDVIPAVEGKYSTYAKSVSDSDIKASRGHRAFGGFSMGSLTAWYVFLNGLDYFQYIMPLSGDCWAGNTADEKAAALESAVKKSGYSKEEYYLMCATGTNDIAYTAMNQQIESMKKLTDSFTYTSDFSKGNLFFLICEGGTHYWDGYIVDYIYDALPYFFHE